MNILIFLSVQIFMVFVTCLQENVIVHHDYEKHELLGSYIIIAPKVIHPGTVYGVMVVWLNKKTANIHRLSVHVEISREGTEITSAATDITLHQSETMYLKVPSSCKPGSYKLRVEGNFPYSVGGTVFLNETELLYSPIFLAIVIQTSRPIYNAGQEVYFRVILLTTEMKPYEDTVNMYILDADNIIVRRWMSVQLNNGVISHKFALPELAKVGFWKIQVKADYQIEEQLFRVENYFLPLFEVHVMMPAYHLESEEYIQAKIHARSSIQRVATGNLTFKCFARLYKENSAFIYVAEETDFMKNGQYDLSFPLQTIKYKLGSLNDVEIKIEAKLTENLYGITVTGHSHTRIIQQSIQLKFLGPSPKVFKPGMMFEGHVVVAYNDMQSLSEDLLSKSTISVHASVLLQNGERLSHEVLQPDINVSIYDLSFDDANATSLHVIEQIRLYRQTGVLSFAFNVPKDSERITLTAFYKDEEGDSAVAETQVVKMFSSNKKYLSLRTSTHDIQTGEYVIFHIKSNFYMLDYFYLIICKDLLLYSGQVSVETNIGTFSTLPIPVAENMSPGFTFIIFHVTEQNEIISDKLFVPVTGFKGYECSLVLNQGKDHTMNTAEAIMPADAGAFMGINAQRSSSYFMQAGNDITQSRIVESYFKFENHPRVDSRVMWKSREGLFPEESNYYSSMNDALDNNQTFQLADLIIFTDVKIISSLYNSNEQCHTDEGYMPCATEGCYLKSSKCDKHKDCSDGSDENYCEEQKDEHYEYRLLRRSISSEMYDEIGAHWGWQEMNGEYGGEEYFKMYVPSVTDDWYFTAFSVSKELGFTTIDKPVQYSSMKPFIMNLKGPSLCHHGEQIAIQALLVNNEPYEMLVLLLLHGSEQYKFVHVEEDGIVSSYSARLSTGDHQHIVYLAPKTQQEVNLPISPTVEQGDIVVRVSALTQAAKSEYEHKVTVLPEGGLINKHTSVLLDMKNRALVLKYLDIVVEESPIVPYQNWRRYVYGSPKGTVYLSSDIIGPVFPEIPLTTKIMLKQQMKGTEARIFELASNIWTLHYLRLTNQLEQRVLREVMEGVNVIYAQVMKRFDSKGFFRNWDTSESSVWLTAWTIRILQQAMFPEWEDYFFVQPSVFTNSVSWILKFQTGTGSFIENAINQNVYEPHLGNITLTAHVLIALHTVLQSVKGQTKTMAAVASLAATRFLEHMVPSMSDPYEICLVTYALTVSASSKKDVAFQLLQRSRRKGANDQLYWSKVPIPANEVKIENQKPFIRHREYQDHDSLAVEATSLALMVYLIHNGITTAAEQIVHWLTSTRMSTNGFISTIDTVIALQSLTEYAYRARLQDITDMNIVVNVPSSPGFHKWTLHVDKSNMSVYNNFEIPNVWGHINVIGRGSGQAVVQMDVSYGIDYEPLMEVPPVNSFDLQIAEFYSSFRNKSAVTIQSCLSWIQTNRVMSGPAILEIDLPTGYHLPESEAMKVVLSQAHPMLRDVRIIDGKSIWFFDHIDQNLKCFNHTVTRWYPAANMTLYRQAFLYEMHSREHFVRTLFNSTSLYILSICEVCGSYQCPYCPYYSCTNMKLANHINIMAFILLHTTIYAFKGIYNLV